MEKKSSYLTSKLQYLVNSSSANRRTYSTGFDTLRPPAVYELAFYQSNE